MDEDNTNWVFIGLQQTVIIISDPGISDPSLVKIAAALFQGGVPDTGVTKYLATMILDVSSDASGTFTIEFIALDGEVPGTFLLNQYIGYIPLQGLFPALITVFPDCNYNGIPDSDDIAGGTSTDCNGNNIPDECEPQGACCTSATTCSFISECSCNAQGGSYRGNGVICIEVTAMKGACCVGTTCLPNKTECACDNLNGSFQGSGSRCTPRQCLQFFIPP